MKRAVLIYYAATLLCMLTLHAPWWLLVVPPLVSLLYGAFCVAFLDGRAPQWRENA